MTASSHAHVRAAAPPVSGLDDSATHRTSRAQKYEAVEQYNYELIPVTG